MSLHLAPRLSETRPGRLEYGVHPGLRIAAGGLAASIFLFAPSLLGAGPLRILGWVLGFLLGFFALSEDRWIFDAPRAAGEASASSRGKVGRRYGLLPSGRSWELPSGELSSLELRRGGPDDTLSGGRDSQAVLEKRLLGLGKGPWSALVLVLQDGRSIALAGGSERQAPRFAAEGARIAAQLGLPFVSPTEASNP